MRIAIHLTLFMNYQYSIVNRKSSIDNWPTGRSAALELGWDLASLDNDVSWFAGESAPVDDAAYFRCARASDDGKLDPGVIKVLNSLRVRL